MCSFVSFIVFMMLHKVKIMKSRLFPLILLLHIQGTLTLKYHPMSCIKESICAVKGSKVTLKCHNNINIKTAFWFSQKQSTNWRINNEAEDLTLDSDYSGRVKSSINNYTLQLTISDVRERDSGEYRLMFIMKDGDKHLASVAVNLTVTDLQVKMNPESTDSTDQNVELTCDSSCTSESWYYYWKKDGKYLTNTRSRSKLTISRYPNCYSCSIDQDLKNPSSSVCVSKSGCWDVSYTSRRICAVINSTVDISSTYSHPSDYTVNKTFWHYGRIGGFRDLREEHQFAGRVEFVENKLRIKELKISDSGEYKFRIITDKTGGTYSGSPGVILTVTDTQVISRPHTLSEGEKVILSCSTKCTLSNKHTYIWYKKGQQVIDGFTKDNKLYLDSVSNEELKEFSCAVGGLKESTALRNTAVVLCVFLSFVLIGVLWLRWRRCTLFKPQRAEKEEVQYDTVHINAVSSELRQKADADNPDVHYSSIRFTTKPTPSNPTSEYPADSIETESVHYATVMFK